MTEKIDLIGSIVNTLLDSEAGDFVISKDINKNQGEKTVVICKAGQVIQAGDLEKAAAGNEAAKSRIRKYMKMIKLLSAETIKDAAKKKK